MFAGSAPIMRCALESIVKAESVALPSCPSQTNTSVAPPSKKPATALLISPVSNCRSSASFGSVCSWRQMPATPSASVIMNTVFGCAKADMAATRAKSAVFIVCHSSVSLEAFQMEELMLQFQCEHFRDPAGQSLGHPLEAEIVRVGAINQTVPAGWADQIGALN